MPISQPTAQPTVMIVAHGSDAMAAREAAMAATAQGRRVTLNVGAPTIAAADAARFDLVVIILSAPAVRGEAFVDYINAIARAARTVAPVRVDGMRPEWAGPDVDQYNCADFSQSQGPARMARWNDLFRLNIASYDAFNALRASAERWARNGGGDDFLIQDRHRAEESARLVARMAADPFARPDETMRAYTAGSVAYAARVRRRRIRSNIRVGIAVALVVAFVAGTILFTRWANQRFVAAMQSVSRFQSDVAPEFSTFRTIQAAEAGGVDESAAAATIRDGLARDWTLLDIGVENSRQGDYTGSGVFSDDGSRFVAESSGGVLRVWNVATAKPSQAWRVAQGRFEFALAADGRTAAVTGDKGLVLVDLGHGSARVIDAKTPVLSRVAADKDATRVMVEEGDHVAVWRNGDGLRDSTAKGEVFDVKRTDRGLRALVRDGDTLHVVGEDVDATPVDLALPKDSGEFVYGVIGADGTIVVIDAGRLLVAQRDDQDAYPDGLKPVGIITRDSPLGLAVSADGRTAAVSTSQDGVRLIDLGHGLDLGTVCETITAVTYPAFSREGLLACGNGLDVAIQSTDAMTPTDARPAGARVSDTTTPRAVTETAGGAVRVQATDDGAVSVTTPAGIARATVAARHGTPTVAAVTPQGDAVAVGTDTGDVIAWDIGTADKTSGGGGEPTLTMVRRWSSPDGDAIDRLGWSRDRSRLAAHTASGWWRPWSLAGTATLAGATAAATARNPVCWPSYNMTAFGGSFARRHDLTACAAAPAATATTGDGGIGE